jgi:predicted transcriptional regulator
VLSGFGKDTTAMTKNIAARPASSSRIGSRIKQVRFAKELTPTAKLVARSLLDFIGDNPSGWPSIRRLTQETCLSPSSVKRSLKTLQDAGLIEIRPRTRRDGSNTSNAYFWHDQVAAVPSPSKRTKSVSTSVHPEPPPVHPEPSLHEDLREDPTKKHNAAKPPCVSEEKPKKKPRKRYVEFSDSPKVFRSFEHLSDAYRKSIKANLLSSSEVDRVRFFTAAAAIVRKIDSKKVGHPARLLRWLLDRKEFLITYANQDDENRARTAIRKMTNQGLLES